MKEYEALFILSESVREDRVEDVVNRLRREIEKLGGTIGRAADMGRRSFAVQLKKREAGHYLRLDFAMDPTKLAGLTSRMKLMEDLFRVQIVAAPKPMAVKVSEAEAPAGEAPAAGAAAEGSHGVA